MNPVELQIKVNGEFVPVELDKSTQFSLNYAATDIENPVLSKNTYSNTISIPKTKHNNALFGHIWDVRSIKEIFDSNRHVDFRLHLNNNIFEIGYIKMEEITKKDYQIRLFGNLGNFFYYLNSIKLCDLNLDYSHRIDRNQITRRGNDYGYALTYQGDYDKFDNGSTDKGSKIENVIWEKSRNEVFTNVELKENHRQLFIDSNFSGEYRSYYQKPTLKLSPIIEAILKKAGEKGFNVVFDEFCSDKNPYWNDLWILSNNLPVGDMPGGYAYSVSTFGYTGKGGLDADTTCYIDKNEAKKYNNEDIEEDKYRTKSLNIKPCITDIITLGARETLTAKVGLRIMAVDFQDHNNDRQALVKGYKNRTNPNLLVNFVVFRSSDGTTISRTASPVAATYDKAVAHRRYNDTNVVEKRGTKVNGHNYFGRRSFLYDHKKVDKNTEDGKTIWKHEVTYENSGDSDIDVKLGFEIEGNSWWDAENKEQKEYAVAFEIKEGSILIEQSKNTENSNKRTYSPRTFKELIGSDKTCLDLLLSYTKLFGLMYKINPATGNVEILQRTNFYTDKILDWTNKVDRSKEYLIKDTALSFRKGIFKYNPLNTKYENDYRFKTAEKNNDESGEYGSKQINTGYELDNNEFNYLDGTIFDNCVIVSDYSKYYAGRSSIFKDNKQLPHLEDDGGKGIDLAGFCLLFRVPDQPLSREARITDDTDFMRTEGNICWNDSGKNSLPVQNITCYYRTWTFNNEVYSLNLGTPSYFYSDSEKLMETNENCTIFARYWKSYLDDKLDENSKIVTCNITLKPSDIQDGLLSKFIYLDQSLWVIQKIHAFNPLSEASTKVDLVKVKDKNNYLILSNITDEFTISYAGNNIYKNTDGVNPETIQIAEGITRMELTVSSGLNWSASSDITLSPANGQPGTTDMTVTLGVSTNSGRITFRYGLNSITINIVRKVVRTVTATTINGTAAYINGQASSIDVNIESTVVFTSTGEGLFLYWDINGEIIKTASPTYTIRENTTAKAYYAVAEAHILYCDDPYTSITGHEKQDDNFWILEAGQSYTFTNSENDFSGFLFSGDSAYTPRGARVITAEDTYLAAFYDQVLLNTTITNHSPLYEFTGDRIFIDEDEPLSFDVEPLQTLSLPLSVPVNTELTFERMDYHYPVFSRTSFGVAGIYNLVIDAHRVGWDGDVEESVNGGFQEITRTCFSPVAFTINSNIAVNPTSSNGETDVDITLLGYGGEVVQHVDGLKYTLKLNQDVSEIHLGWTEERLFVLEAHVDWNETVFESSFYHAGYPVVIGSGLTELSSTQEYVCVKAEFDANTGSIDKQLIFTITANNTAYQLVITQKAGGKDIGWTDNYLPILQASVAYDVMEYTDTFYYKGLEYTLSDGLTASDDTGTSFKATTTFGENETTTSQTLTFYVTVNGVVYQLIIIQAGNPGAERTYWGQSGSTEITGSLTDADGLTPSQSCMYDIGSSSLLYNNGWFCNTLNVGSIISSGNITAPTFSGDLSGNSTTATTANATVGTHTISVTGGNVVNPTFNGSENVTTTITIPTSTDLTINTTYFGSASIGNIEIKPTGTNIYYLINFTGSSNPTFLFSTNVSNGTVIYLRKVYSGRYVNINAANVVGGNLWLDNHECAMCIFYNGIWYWNKTA